jgi:ATPase subunit of ABC transporter with duplicated ATPase domains
VGHVEVAHVSHVLADGRQLLDDASFKIPDGATAAIVGPNGAGKTTLLRMLAGDVQPTDGTVSISGAVGVMRQFIGGPQAKGTTVRDLLLSVSPARVRGAAKRLDESELEMMERDDEPAQLRYAKALNDYAEAGGYDQEVHWDECCVAAVKQPYDQVKWREVDTLSGGQQKRLVLESLLRSGTFTTLLLDEPDNYLDVPGKRWLEGQLAATSKTVLLVSHDRELLNACAQRIVTVEDGKTWVHGGGFKTYAKARLDRIERLEELRRRWDEEHEKIKELVRMYRVKASHNSDMASRLQAAVTRLAKFEEIGPPEEPPREQHIKVRLKGARTGRRAVMVEQLAVNGTTNPFDTEIWYGDRVAVLGANGSGKSTFIRLLAGEQLPHVGRARLGARVVPGMFAQTHARPDLAGRTPVEIVMTEHARLMTEAMKALARYELHKCAKQPFATLSGGQQARLQILLLELGGATLLLLDEPTDNLDLPSADALQAGLEAYQGTVLAVTHDRWFAASFDRFLVFAPNGTVRESASPVWD